MKLKPGEYKCEECKGTGYDLRPNHYKCPKCLGEGKLDWVERVVGKKTPEYDFNGVGVTWTAPSNSPPQNPIIGQAYINSNSQEVHVYDGIDWVQVVSMTTPM